MREVPYGNGRMIAGSLTFATEPSMLGRMSPKAPAHTVDALVERVRAYDANADADTIRLAYDFAKEAHKEQKRATGEPYIIHPLATAMNLAEMRLPAPIIIAGLLHDVPEDTPRTLEDVRNAFGEDVANMVAGITKLGNRRGDHRHPPARPQQEARAHSYRHRRDRAGELGIRWRLDY